MTTTTAPHRPHRTRPARGTPLAPAVVVLLCGSSDRGDDGAALAISGLLLGRLAPDVVVRSVGQVDIDDLLAIGHDTGVVIVDAATGLAPGEIVELPLRGFLGSDVVVRPRSSHALEMPEVIGVAEMIRGHPFDGRIVVVGARSFRLGHPLTRTVAASLSALARAVADAVTAVRLAVVDRHARQAGARVG